MRMKQDCPKRYLPEFEEDVATPLQLLALEEAEAEFEANSTLANGKIYYHLFREAGYPGHIEETCHAPWCNQKVDWDAWGDGYYDTYCSHHNEHIHLGWYLGEGFDRPGDPINSPVRTQGRASG